MKDIRKSLLAVLGAVVVAIHELVTQGPWTPARVLMVVLAGLTAFTVYVATNLPEGHGVGTWAKAFVALAVAGVEVAIPLLNDNAIVGSEWLVIVMAVLTAAGVPLVRNGDKPAVVRDGAHQVTDLR